MHRQPPRLKPQLTLLCLPVSAAGPLPRLWRRSRRQALRCWTCATWPPQQTSPGGTLWTLTTGGACRVSAGAHAMADSTLADASCACVYHVYADGLTSIMLSPMLHLLILRSDLWSVPGAVPCPCRADFRTTKAGRMVTHTLVKNLERFGVAPKGSLEVATMLERAADGLVAGGKQGIFTPLFFFLVRKPAARS